MASRVIIAIAEKADGTLKALYTGRDASQAEAAIEAAGKGSIRFERAYLYRNPRPAKRKAYDPAPASVPLSSSPPAKV